MEIDRGAQDSVINIQDVVIVINLILNGEFDLVADIILDSLEWSGLNTSLEAISFDKPIITLPSKFMRSKHTSAVLKILKIDELICSNKRDYVDMAVKLSINSIFYEDISKKIKMNKKSLFNNYKPIKFLEDFFTTLIKDK